MFEPPEARKRVEAAFNLPATGQSTRGVSGRTTTLIQPIRDAPTQTTDALRAAPDRILQGGTPPSTPAVRHKQPSTKAVKPKKKVKKQQRRARKPKVVPEEVEIIVEHIEEVNEEVPVESSEDDDTDESGAEDMAE